jgi:gliding motility-associated-like protein
MKKLLFLIYISFVTHVSVAQQIYYQDIIKGGVTGSGFAGNGFGTLGTGQFEIYIEPGSTIKRAFLIRNKFESNPEINQFGNVNLNGVTYRFDASNQVTPEYLISWESGGLYKKYGAVNVIDITSDIDPTILLYDVTLEFSPLLFEGGSIEDSYGPIYFIVIYENSSLPEMAVSIMLNNQDLRFSARTYEFEDLNRVDSSYPVGFALFTDRMNETVLAEDGSYVYFNGDSLGLVGGISSNDLGGGYGVRGDFYYQNNTLYGLTDDTANTTMKDYDALADVSSLIPYNATTAQFRLNWQDSTHNNRYNIYNAFFLTYTSTCANFEAQTSFTDTTICKGASINLNATGGATYKWQPATFLDCDTCATPVCTPQNSQWYTCTITTADSCSKTIPVFVGVYEPPTIAAVVVKGDTCGLDVGSVAVYAKGAAPFVYRLDAWAQTEQLFTNLKGDTYNLEVTDVHGCRADTTIEVPLHNNVSAGFKIDKAIGEAPLTINLTDQSINATNWEWYIANDTLFTQNPSYIFEENDTFSVMQVVYNTYPECADTAITRVMVFKPIEVHIPNVFTPNQDQTNEDFFITLTGGEFIQWNIYNRWGQRVAQGEKEITLDQQDIYLWDGIDINSNLPAADGVYFYDIVIRTPADVVRSFSGNLTVLCTRC